MDIDFNLPSIITKRNVDSNNNPISVKLIETKQVLDNHSCIVLNQTPDESYRLVIEGFTEVFDIDKLDKRNYKVDYSQGVVYFHPKNIGKTVVIEYYGVGYELISASRVFYKTDKHGNIIETIEELIEGAEQALELIKTLGNAVDVINKLEEDVASGNRLHDNLTNDIAVGTPLQENLHADIVEANKWKDQLKQDVIDGKVIQPLLHNDIIEGNQTKAELEQTIADAQDDINKIEATGNEIVTITASQWTYNDTSKMYEKQITHKCNSENVHVTCKTSDTKEALFLPWKIIDKNSILLKSDEVINVSVIISASYYKAQTTISDDIAEEVVNARKGKTSLYEKVNSIDEQLEQKASKDDVARISSGTPLFANGITEMTDTTKNYVNIDDGYLYIYSRGAWSKTTLPYQATGIADKSVTTKKIDDKAIMINNINPSCVENVNGVYFESNRTGIIDHLEVVYDLENLEINTSNIDLVLEYGFKGFNTDVKSITIMVDRSDSLTASSSYISANNQAITSGEIRTTNIEFNSARVGRYLHILYGILKPSDLLLKGDLFYSKVTGNGINIEKIANVFMYSKGSHEVIKQYSNTPEQLVTFKTLEKKLGGDRLLVTTDQIKDNAITYNKLDADLIMPMEITKKVYIEGKYGGSYDKGIWGDIHFNIDKSKLAIGKKLKFTFAIVLDDKNFEGMNLVTWHGTAIPNSGAHASWFNGGKVFSKIQLGKAMIVEREEIITQSMYDALMTDGKEYRICPVPYVNDITQTNSYKVWDINIYVDGEKIDIEITSINAISGGSANFKGKIIDGYKANTLVSSNYPNIIEEKLYDLSEKIIPPKFYGKNGIAFGDSITQGTEGGYVKYIQEILQCNLTNKGSSGANTGRLVGIMTHIKDRDGYSPQTTPDYTNIDFVTIMIGTNGGVGNSTFNDIPMIIGNTVLDLPFEHNGVTINTEDEYWALFPNKFYSNIALCIEYVQSKNPNTKIFLITPPITKQLGLTYECGIKKVRQAMFEIGEHYAVPIIDAQVNAGIGLNNIYKCTLDGTHLNTFGNKLWGTYVAEQILIK